MPTDVIEAPEAVEPIETAEAAPEEINASEGEEAAEPAALEASEEHVAGDERTLPARIKNLKGVDPKAYREAANDFFGRRALQAQLKGFDLEKARAYLDENGGLEGLELSRTEAQAKAQELDALNEAFTSGDAKVIDQLLQNAPEGFSKLAPAVFDKWQQADPEGWNARLAGVFDATIRQSPLPDSLRAIQYHMNDLNLLLGAIPGVADNPLLVQKWTEMTQQFGEVNKWSQSFKGQPQQPGQQQAAPPKGEQTAAQVRAEIETEKFKTDRQTELKTWRTDEAKKEMAPFYDAKKHSTDLLDIATDRVTAKVLERMTADKDYQSKMSALFARKDTAGMQRLYKSREGAAIKEIAPAVGRSIFGNPKTPETPKPAAVAPKQNTPKRTTNAFDAIWAGARS